MILVLCVDSGARWVAGEVWSYAALLDISFFQSWYDCELQRIAGLLSGPQFS